MATIGAAMSALHVLFAGALTGGVLFVAWAVLPLGRTGDLKPGTLDAVAGKLQTLSRASAVVLFLTGGYMAGERYTAETLTGSTPGQLVLGMIALWLVLTALVEVGARRLKDGIGQGKVRTPARNATRVFQAAALVAVLVLLDAGLLAGGL